MSKTFKSNHPDNKVLNVDNLLGNPRLLIKEFDGDYRVFVCAPSDAPALALAILEAAGYGEEVVTDGSPDGHVRVAKYYLYEGVKAHASITAEAKAQAELEAEALKLFNASLASCGLGQVELFDALTVLDQKRWLAVARKAREMRGATK